jgi:hypothetical protein
VDLDSLRLAGGHAWSDWFRPGRIRDDECRFGTCGELLWR